MSISELTAVVSPPGRRTEGGEIGAWARAQKTIGLSLPTDFRDFGIAYGSGRFCNGFLQVYNPFSKNYKGIIDSELSILRQLRRSKYKPLSFDVIPKRPGLFPWGRDENGGKLCWLVEGDPDNWPLILKTHEDEIERLDTSMTSFLAGALSNKITCILWTERFKPKERVFKPDVKR